MDDLPNMVNDIRYGYVRQGNSRLGVGDGRLWSISGIWPTPTAETRTTILSVPVNNIVDNLSWSKGKHSIQVGGNWRLVHQNHATNANSFNTASTNPSWMGGSTPQPGQPWASSRSMADLPTPTSARLPT